jgi:hypothetical protein
MSEPSRAELPLMSSVQSNQGEQIGRIFAHWAVVYFGQFLKSCRNSSNFGATFSMVQVVCQFCEKMDWAIFWATSSQPHLVTLKVTHQRHKIATPIFCAEMGFWTYFFVI